MSKTPAETGEDHLIATYFRPLARHPGALGLADDAAYNLYDKPLFADRGGSIYRPRRGGDEDGGGEGGAAASRAFKPDVGFAGADYSKAAAAAASGPVQFERDPKEADPFGLDDFVGAVSKGGKGKEKE